MKRAFEFLLDVVLVLVFALISSNYIETLPRYIPKSPIGSESYSKNEVAKGDVAGTYLILGQAANNPRPNAPSSKKAKNSPEKIISRANLTPSVGGLSRSLE